MRVRTARNVDELEDFKTHINLTEYAAAQGYVLDRKASSRSSALMRHDNGDKVVIARGQDGHWIYFSVRDEADNGTIIDFVQHRKGATLGGVRRELRPWSGAGQGLARPHADRFVPQIAPVSRDRAQVIRALARMRPLTTHAYLEQERALSATLLQDPRFAGRILIDARGNAVFPHADGDGPCGYEIKNRLFTGFSSGGEKGLWFSAARTADATLVLAESAIDVLSYAALHPDEYARYASTGGSLNATQPALLQAAMARMPEGAAVVIATDNDEGGWVLAEQIAACATRSGRADLRLRTDLPDGAGADWNDVLCAAAGHGAPE